MSQPPQTQQTVHLAGCYPRTSSLTLFGGKVLHGCSLILISTLLSLCPLQNSARRSCLNSRPLLPLHTHADDGVECLTPGHFLVGHPLQTLPDHDHTDSKLPLLKRWSLCQVLSQRLWRRWSQEYLQQLQKLTKWRTPSRNISPGDVILIKEDSLVSTHWPMGRVEQTFPGKDGKSEWQPSGLYRRPVAKLVLLLPQEDSQDVSSFGGWNVGASRDNP